MLKKSTSRSLDSHISKKEITIALAGNPNAGKSVVFNQLTGGNQIIGNWPGKTVERTEGWIRYRDRRIRIVDLPGIYSLSTYTEEELIAREFIISGIPDVIINVIDASLLERSLFLTLQLLEMEKPLVLAVNQLDVAESKGLKTDIDALSKLLSIPAVGVIATRGTGLNKLLTVAIESADKQDSVAPPLYGGEIEQSIEELEKILDNAYPEYPVRWLAIKIIENDEDIKRLHLPEEVLERADVIRRRLEETHGEPIEVILSSERYALASRIARTSQRYEVGRKTLLQRLDSVLLHPVFGYISMGFFLFVAFIVLFKIGSIGSSLLEGLFSRLAPMVNSLALPETVKELLWDGLLSGIISGITIALPYILPFYIFLSFLENSGYLARIAFLTDNIMHKLGLHGKGAIPIIMGYGCNVPAILGTRILESRRERVIASLLATLIPCSARTVVILGLVGAFMGLKWAFVIYLLDLVIVYMAGFLMNRYYPGETPGLIMEVPDIRIPPLKPSLRQSWFRIKEFLYIALPYIMLGSVILELIKIFGWFDTINRILSPVIVNWLGLPPITGVVLIFGLLRKELTLILLSTFSGTTNFSTILNPRQMFVFSFFVTLYVPCLATVAALKKELGNITSTLIVIGEILISLILAGLLNHIWIYMAG
ncbi:MAG TPA: ferrous iron transport protein B [bacterium]|nr:ferrous iron transport protein B [bacterium]